MDSEAIQTDKTLSQKVQVDRKQEPAPPPKSLEGRRVMDAGIELLRKRKHDEFWKEYCSFIDLSLQEVIDHLAQ